MGCKACVAAPIKEICMKTLEPATPAQALIAAIHAVRPPVLANGLVVDKEKPNLLETVNVTFALTPELVKAWGDECARLSVGR